MKCQLPKVLIPLNEWPLISFILEAVRRFDETAEVAIVVGHGKDQVIDAVKNEAVFSKLQISFVEQPAQLGTGDAVRCAMQSPWGETVKKERRPVVVLPGDTPLVSSTLLRELAEPLAKGFSLRFVSCDQLDPTGYGRVIRRGRTGPVLKIVEHADASAKEREVKEVATSMYLFDSAFLASGLQAINNRNAQKEFYLTDLIGFSARRRLKMDTLKWPNAHELVGVNTPVELADATRILNSTCVRNWAEKGVRFLAPDSAWVSFQVELAPDVEIAPGVQISGKTKIGSRSVIGAHSILKNVLVGEAVEIKPGTVAELSTIGARSKVGPYAHLRPGSEVAEDCKIGNFVELKQSRIGRSTSIAHLSYVGDAEVGERVNIGCGFVTCNFDGRERDGKRKHKTVIEDDVFMGSDCQAIAPIRIRRGAYIASGSTLTADVPEGALAIARSRQVNKEGLADRLLGRKNEALVSSQGADQNSGENATCAGSSDTLDL